MDDAPLPHRHRDERPWGGFVQFTENEPCTVKILTVHAEQAFSLQTHTSRDEFWRILSGTGTITVDAVEKEAASGDEFWIARGSRHRARAHKSDLFILEISFGQFDEDDIQRIEDDYGRS